MEQKKMKYFCWTITETEDGEWEAKRKRGGGFVEYVAPRRTLEEMKRLIREVREWENACRR